MGGVGGEGEGEGERLEGWKGNVLYRNLSISLLCFRVLDRRVDWVLLVRRRRSA